MPPCPAKAACSAASPTASATSNPKPADHLLRPLTRQHEDKASQHAFAADQVPTAPERAESGMSASWFRPSARARRACRVSEDEYYRVILRT